jgi:hypothetical protein
MVASRYRPFILWCVKGKIARVSKQFYELLAEEDEVIFFALFTTEEAQ